MPVLQFVFMFVMPFVVLGLGLGLVKLTEGDAQAEDVKSAEKEKVLH